MAGHATGVLSDPAPSRRAALAEARQRIYPISRSIIVGINLACLGAFFWQPQGAVQWTLEILVRSYLCFLGTVMAHEGTHGLLGRTKRDNIGWGRLALLPLMVPFGPFRKTHVLHHAHTNHPERDPDYFLARAPAWRLVYRALWVPHHWIVWLHRNQRLTRADVRDLLVNYLLIWSVFGALAVAVGPTRIIYSMVPTAVLVSWLLWFPFAYRTHEGWSLGASAARSHAYYGAFLYWFTLGLSQHRAHHEDVTKSWLGLREFVQPVPGPAWKIWRQVFSPRDIRTQ